MTREEAKQKIYNASKEDTSSPKDCIHLLSLHRFIEQIFDEHEAHVNDLRNAIDRYMEEAAMYKSILDKAEAQLKAKDKHIAELEKAMKPKTCDGCIYGVFGVDSFGLEIECTLAYRCSRGQDDMFKQKEQL